MKSNCSAYLLTLMYYGPTYVTTHLVSKQKLPMISIKVQLHFEDFFSSKLLFHMMTREN